MFTKYDKAITAVVISILTFLGTWISSLIGVTPEIVAGVLALLNPIAVYFVPNKVSVTDTASNVSSTGLTK